MSNSDKKAGLEHLSDKVLAGIVEQGYESEGMLKGEALIAFHELNCRTPER